MEGTKDSVDSDMNRSVSENAHDIIDAFYVRRNMNRYESKSTSDHQLKVNSFKVILCAISILGLD